MSFIFYMTCTVLHESCLKICTFSPEFTRFSHSNAKTANFNPGFPCKRILFYQKIVYKKEKFRLAIYGHAGILSCVYFFAERLLSR